jgi:hypothetical protein
MVEQEEMIGEEYGELVDDRHAARLAGLRGNELLVAHHDALHGLLAALGVEVA